MTRDYIHPDWHAALAANGLDSFDRLWSVAENSWFEPPNYARGGWSGVARQVLKLADGRETGIFVKRQENHTYLSWRHFFRSQPTLEREFRNCMRFQKLGIPAMDPLFYGKRRVNGKLRAILVTRELEGYQPLGHEDVRSWHPIERKLLIERLAGMVHMLHKQRFQHTCLYPKHLFVRKNPDGDLDTRFIDLEKTRWLPFRTLVTRRDLNSLHRHARGWNRTDRLRFFLAYRQEKKLSPKSKRLLRTILDRRKN
jgi:hypothetical protein